MGGRVTSFALVGLMATAIAAGPSLAGGPGPGAPGPKPDKADRPDKEKRDQSTILVQFLEPGYSNDDLVQQDGDQANGAVGDLKTKTVIVKLKKDANVDDKIAEYEARDDVIYAEANGTMDTSDDPGFTAQDGQSGNGAAAQSAGGPNDQYFNQEWGMTKIHAPEAWAVYPGKYTALTGPPI